MQFRNCCRLHVNALYVIRRNLVLISQLLDGINCRMRAAASRIAFEAYIGGFKLFAQPIGQQIYIRIRAAERFTKSAIVILKNRVDAR